MELDGLDAEIGFPELTLWLYAIGDTEAEAVSARLYNDWNHGMLSAAFPPRQYLTSLSSWGISREVL